MLLAYPYLCVLHFGCPVPSKKVLVFEKKDGPMQPYLSPQPQATSADSEIDNKLLEDREKIRDI